MLLEAGITSGLEDRPVLSSEAVTVINTKYAIVPGNMIKRRSCNHPSNGQRSTSSGIRGTALPKGARIRKASGQDRQVPPLAYNRAERQPSEVEDTNHTCRDQTLRLKSEGNGHPIIHTQPTKHIRKPSLAPTATSRPILSLTRVRPLREICLCLSWTAVARAVDADECAWQLVTVSHSAWR